MKVHKWSKTSTKSVIGHLQLRTKAEKPSKENYHHLKICPIEGCFKVPKNLGEHFCSKMHKLKPGPDCYQLLKSAKPYLPMTPGSIEFSPRRYLEKKYQCKSEDNVSENKDLCSKSNSRKKLEYDNVDHTAASPTDKTDVELTEYATVTGNITSNSFGDITDIHNESESDTEKMSSSRGRECYKDDDDGKDSDHEPSQLLECSSALEKTLEGFYQFLIGPDKGRKPRSVENVVSDVRRIFKIAAVDNVTALFQNDMNVLRKKYLNSYRKGYRTRFHKEVYNLYN